MTIYNRASPYGFQKSNTVKTRAELKALNPVYLADRGIIDLDDGSSWKYVSLSTAVDATEQLVIAPAPAAPDVAPATGRWVRFERNVDLSLAVSAATADLAVLFTVPVGFSIRVASGYWDVSLAFTGGTSSAIGLASSNAAYSTAGDVLGGASGDVAAGLTTGAKRGTQGTKYGSGGAIVLVAGDTIRFNRITSAFTAGTGNAVLPVRVLAAP